MSVSRILLIVVSIVTLAACGSDDAATSSVPDTERPATSAQNGTTADSMGDMDHDGTTADPMEDMDHEGGAEETAFAFGRPADAADAADADRTIEIRTSNELAFDPAEVAVATGETVTFSITNDGDLLHDFVIGDEAAQQEHAEEMAEMPDGIATEGEQHIDANAVSVPLGETVELTWTFDGETEGLLYGCHEPGHYEAGMVGDIVVEG